MPPRKFTRGPTYIPYVPGRPPVRQYDIQTKEDEIRAAARERQRWRRKTAKMPKTGSSSSMPKGEKKSNERPHPEVTLDGRVNPILSLPSLPPPAQASPLPQVSFSVDPSVPSVPAPPAPPPVPALLPCIPSVRPTPTPPPLSPSLSPLPQTPSPSLYKSILMLNESNEIHELTNYLKSNEPSLEEILHRVTEYAKKKTEEKPDDAVPSLAMVDLSCRTLLLCLTSSDYRITKDTFADLLDVLAMAESYRLRIVEQVDRAIAWQEYCLKHDPEQALPDKEADTLRQIYEDQQDWRDIYVRIVEKAITLDLYHIYVSIPWSLTDYLVRFFEYFPSSSTATDDAQVLSRRSIEHLTELEKEILLKKSKKEVLAFVHASFDWLQKRPENVSILDALHSKEFEEEFPPPHNLDRFKQLVEEYLKQIRKALRLLLATLPSEG